MGVIVVVVLDGSGNAVAIDVSWGWDEEINGTACSSMVESWC